MKFFSVPADFRKSTVDRLAELNARHEDAAVTETYGNATVGGLFGSGRIYPVLPYIGLRQLEKYVGYAASKGINFNYTLNPSCAGNIELTGSGLRRVERFIARLWGMGIRHLTVSMPTLMTIIKDSGHPFSLKASTICQVNSAFKAEHYRNRGLDRLVIDEDITRNFRRIRQICAAFGDGVEMIVNSVCIRDCPNKMFHYNHDAHFSITEVIKFYSYYCRGGANVIVDPINFMRLNWVRPEDLGLYESAGINRFKLQGRDLALRGDVPMAVETYMDASYDGNLFDLLWLFDSATPYYPYIDNKALEGFLKPFFDNPEHCTEDCDACGHCASFAAASMDSEANRKLIPAAKEKFNKREEPFAAYRRQGEHEQMKRKLSKYIYEYEMEDGKVGLFNSVFLTKKFIDKDIWSKFKCSTDFSWIPVAEMENLEDGKIILEDDEDDKRLNELRAESAMRPSVELMYLFITKMCNLKCRYCLIDKEYARKETGEFMTVETIGRALELFLKNTKTEKPVVLIWGGEPLSNWAVFKYAVERARELEKKYSKTLELGTVTNGTLMTTEIADFFKKNRVGCSISMDGFKDQHDRMRTYADGRGTYDDIRNNLKLLKEAGVEFGISLVIGSHNVDLLPMVGRKLCKELEVKFMGSSLPLNVDTANPAYTDSEKAASQLINLFEGLCEDGVLDEQMTRKVKSFAFSVEHLHNCAAGGSQIAVMPNGDVGICHYAAAEGKWLIGNVMDTSENVLSSRELAEWARRSPINMPQCYECPGLVICGGGCPYEAYQKEGDLWALDDNFCAFCRKSIKWMMEKIYKAPGQVESGKSAVLMKMKDVVAHSRFIRAFMPTVREALGETVSEGELQRGADNFRRSNGLASAKATEEWMSRHGITLEFFEEFLEAAILFSTYKHRQNKLHPPVSMGEHRIDCTK